MDGFYTLYPVSIPFVLVGFAASCRQCLSSFRRRAYSHGFLFLSFYTAGLVAIGFSRGYLYRANYLFIAYLYFLVGGILAAYRFARSLGKYFCAALGVVYLLSAAMFIGYYFTSYSPAEDIPQFVPANDAIAYAKSLPEIREIHMDYAGVDEFYTLFFPESPYAIAEAAHEEGYGTLYFQITADTAFAPGNAYIVLKNNTALRAYIEDRSWNTPPTASTMQRPNDRFTQPTLYPFPQTTFRYLGSLGFFSIFSLIWRICTAMVLSAPIACICQIFS